MALTKNRKNNRYVNQELRTWPMKGGSYVYEGAFMGLDGGYARPLVAGDMFAGIAYEKADNSSGGKGDAAVRVFTMGDFEVSVDVAAVIHNLRRVYAIDDETLRVLTKSMLPEACGKTIVGKQMGVAGPSRIVLRISV